MDISKGYDTLIEAIIRPPRDEYDIEELGGTRLTLGSRTFEREDFELVNPRGLRLFCSMYRPTKRPAKLPCVIYCHGNAGSRLAGIEALRTLLPMNLMVVTFDFAGCGMSEGEYISLGFFEKDDVHVVVEHLRQQNLVTRIGLWGRSMGAATAIQCAQADPSLACIVCDSPFSSLLVLATELVQHAEFSIPNFMFKIAFSAIRKSVKKRAKFDIKKLDNVKAAQAAFVPALFGHGEQDDFIVPSHTDTLQAAYAGDSNKVIFPGDHNSARPPFFMSSLCIFMRNNMIVASDFGADNALPDEQTPEDYFSAIGGGDRMNVFPRMDRRGGAPKNRNWPSDTDSSEADSTEEYMRAPYRHQMGGHMATAVTEEDLIQQAIAMSIAESSNPPKIEDEEDAELAAVLALSAAEAASSANKSALAQIESNPERAASSGSATGATGHEKKSSSSENASTASSPTDGTSKLKGSKDKPKERDGKLEREKSDYDKSEKDKEKKSKKKREGTASTSTSPSTPSALHPDSFDEFSLSPRDSVSPRHKEKDKDKKSKHKSPASTASPPMSPLAKPKSKSADESTVSLDASGDDDLDSPKRKKK